MLWLIGVIILFIGFWLGKRVTEIQHENCLYHVPDINDGNIDFSKIPDEDRNKINRDIELISSVITEICDYCYIIDNKNLFLQVNLHDLKMHQET